MTKQQFDALMPHEFWREVVDRAAVEAPDTLLLAEAFWLLEGYFVRTLGMHRVYNSAFMNMMRDEDNAKYRTVMKNTLEFDPEILQALRQLHEQPRRAHGGRSVRQGRQVLRRLHADGHHARPADVRARPDRGLRREIRHGVPPRLLGRARPTSGLIERHEREIFPLLHRRYLFAGVEHFLLYDFFTTDGAVNEDVFAYSNRFGDERALVRLPQQFADDARLDSHLGRVRGQDRPGRRADAGAAHRWAKGLALATGDDGSPSSAIRPPAWSTSGPASELLEQGLVRRAGRVQCHVFLDFRQVQDDACAPVRRSWRPTWTGAACRASTRR